MPRGNKGPTDKETMIEFFKDLSGQCSLASILGKFVLAEHKEEFVNHVQTQQQQEGYPVVFPREFIIQSLTELPKAMNDLAQTSAQFWLT